MSCDLKVTNESACSWEKISAWLAWLSLNRLITGTNVKLVTVIEATGVRFVLLQVYVGVPRDEGAGEKEREDAIKAVDEACDESQQLRVRQETARIVGKYSFVPVCIFFDSENGSLYVFWETAHLPLPQANIFLRSMCVCRGGGDRWAVSQKRMMIQNEKINGRWLMTPLHFASHNDNSDHASIVKSKYFVLFKWSWSAVSVYSNFVRGAGSGLCRIAPWNCFGDEFWPSLLHNFVTANERGASPKQSHNSIRDNIDPGSSSQASLKMANSRNTVSVDSDIRFCFHL